MDITTKYKNIDYFKFEDPISILDIGFVRRVTCTKHYSKHRTFCWEWSLDGLKWESEFGKYKNLAKNEEVAVAFLYVNKFVT